MSEPNNINKGMKLVIKNPDTSINVSKKSDTVTFLWYLWFFWVLIISLFLFFYLIGNIATLFISLEDEKKFFNVTIQDLNIDEEKTKKINEQYSSPKYELFVVKSSEKNAFAGLGSKIYITDSLLESLTYENELLFILWHEYSHIQKRDVFISLVSEMPVAIIFAFLQWQTDLSLSMLQMGVSNIFSKNIEQRADREWVEYVFEKTWEVGCFLKLFEDENDWITNAVELFSDHPMTQSRIQSIKKYIETKDYKNQEPCKELKIL